MKDFYFRITIIVTGLCFWGTASNPSRKSSISCNSGYQWDEHLLANWSSTRHTSQRTETMDMSSRFFQVLFQSHTRKEWQIKHLDLSNCSISEMTLSPLAPLRALEILNLSNNAMRSLWLDLPSALPSQRSSAHSRLPQLKVLILQRNQLGVTPKGLWKLKSLQSLDLSFNRIVHVGLSDFHSCLQLESIYLRSNKISTIHPEAFKGLKKLQVVDLRSNALTALAPIVTIALELPHLELDLADNQWQCSDSSASLQNVTSASWREKWDAICNTAVENEKPYLETPQIRISRETHLPATPSDKKSLMQSKAEKPQEGMDVHLSALEKAAQVGYNDLKETRPQPPTELRNSQDDNVTDKKDNDSPDLVPLISLSVCVTFVVAFCLGIFIRPYFGRLWQKCCQNKKSGPEDAYSNEGFYDDVEISLPEQHQGTEPHQASHQLKLYESQNPSWATEPSPYDIVIPIRVEGIGRMDLSHPQNPAQLKDNTGARSRDGNVLPCGHAAHSALCGLPNAGTHELISAAQDHYEALEELHYDAVVQESSLYEGVTDRSSISSSLEVIPSSIDGEWDELCLSQSRNVVAPVSKTPEHTNTQGSGESKETGCSNPLEAMGSPMESSEERQARNFVRGMATWEPLFQKADAEEMVSNVYDEVLHHNPRDVDLPSLMPGWASGPHVTPGTEEPEPRDAPFDSLYDLVANYDSDSDEGSLFTLSSEGSETPRSLSEEQASVEIGGASQPLPSRNLGDYQDDVTSAESDEDITPQKILETCEIRDALFGNLFISAPDSFV
ncbi:Leucine-rich repeat-containing protein 66 [Lemmus lemmus]